MINLDWERAKPLWQWLRRATLAAITFLFFLLALLMVFVGFVSYVSRVNLASEFQKTGSGHIDHAFMVLDQFQRDQISLSNLRKNLIESESNYLGKRKVLEEEINISEEYRNYFELVSQLWKVFEDYAALVEDKFLDDVRGINFVAPDLRQSHLIGRPIFRDRATDADKQRLMEAVNPRLEKFRTTIVVFIGKHGNRRAQLSFEEQRDTAWIKDSIRNILRARPEFASSEERERYSLKESVQTLAASPEEAQQLAQMQATLRSYQQVMQGWKWATYLNLGLDGVLKWPTIVLTMVVTLAMGALGGIVSFMRIAIERADTYRLAELLRRTILGVAAALGIFLLAGSGLLVLTAQSSKAVNPSAIELSPYFVAFLAFISGFMADDAFARLIESGKSIFRPDEKKPKDAPQNGQ